MTADEFNEKYKAFLAKGFEDQGLEINIPEVTQYLDEKIFPFLTKVPGFNYSQIKSKFHECRFYVDFGEEDGKPLYSYINYVISREVEKFIDKYLFVEQVNRKRSET